MTIPVWNPETLAYELPDHSGGLFGLPDWTMMNDTGSAFFYSPVLESLAAGFPFILITVIVVSIVIFFAVFVPR